MCEFDQIGLEWVLLSAFFEDGSEISSFMERGILSFFFLFSIDLFYLLILGVEGYCCT